MSTTVGIHEDQKLAQAVHDLVLEGYKGPGSPEYESRERYVWLREAGSALWLDSGDIEAIEKLWSPEMEAVTTNNTLVNQIVSKGSMDGLIAHAARRIRDAQPGISGRDLVMEVAFVVNAKLALSLVEKLGARVSVELHPDVGFDVPATLAFARRYYRINPEQFYVKVPLTPDGFVATRVLSDEGIPVNYTLGFSARQNYLATLFSRPGFVNVFLGRLNSLVEESGLGEPENVGERAALASYEVVRNLRESNPDIPTLQIAASMRNGGQVAKLAGIDVLTVPPKAMQEYLDMELTRDDVRPRTSSSLHVKLDHTKPAAAMLHRLWDVDDRFMKFAQDAVAQAGRMESGHDLVELSREHKVNLFHEWTAEERREIRDKGKIPDLSRWPDAPIDDLMSISALESFAKDQEELDSRIAGLIEQV